MKLATTTGDFNIFNYNDEESIRAIHKAGFNYIDYSFDYDYKTRTGFYGNNWSDHGKKMLELSKELGVTFVQSHSPMGQPLVQDSKQQQFIEDTKRAIEAAAYLGIPNIVVHSGYLYKISKMENLVQNKIFYQKLLPVAEQTNINILTENFITAYLKDYYWNDTAPDTLDLCEYINNPRLGICWDTGHGNLPNHSNLHLTQRESINILSNHVYALHVQDNFGGEDNHILPLFGTLDIDSLMQGLNDIKYKGYFTFEADNIPSIQLEQDDVKNGAKCNSLPAQIRNELENMLYRIGKYILEKYNCFEE